MPRAHEDFDHGLCPTCGGQLPDDKWLIFDTANSIVVADNQTIKFTPSEFAILNHLKSVRGRAVSKQFLHFLLYERRVDDEVPFEKIMDTWICKIRRKLKGTRLSIETVWSVGVRLLIDGESR